MVDWTSLIGVFLGFKSDLGRRRKSFGWVGQFVTIALNGGAAQLSPCRSDRCTLRESNSLDQIMPVSVSSPRAALRVERSAGHATRGHIVLIDECANSA